MIKRHSIKFAGKQLAKAKTIAIVAHVMPDADAFSSLVALKNLITESFAHNKVVHLFAECEEIDEIYLPLLKNDTINPTQYKKYDLAIAVDTPCIDRLGIYSKIFKSAKDTLNIDHHETNNYFAKNNIITKTTSACETIYTIFNSLGYEISDEICKVLYAGIITDTANLTQGSFGVYTYKMLTNFMQRKINLNLISEYFFKNNSLAKTKLLQKAIESLSFTKNDKIACMKLLRSDFSETGANFTDTLGIINHAIDIKDVMIAIIFIQQDDGSYYVSIRGKEGIDVAQIAREFGGGGHENMSAFSSSEPLTTIKQKLLKTCRRYIKLAILQQTYENLFFS